MICCASLVLTLAAAPADTTPAFAAQVAGAVAAQWGVAPEQVRLEWGRMPAGAGDSTASVQLRGTGADGWFVALVTGATGTTAVRVRAGTEAVMPVAARALPVRHVVTEEDLGWTARIAWGAPIADTLPNPVGSLVKRALAAGEPLVAPAVGAAPLVQAGQPLVLVWQSGAVEVEMAAVALGTAGLGETVRAKGPGGERLKGTMIAPGRASTLGARP